MRLKVSDVPQIHGRVAFGTRRLDLGTWACYHHARMLFSCSEVLLTGDLAGSILHGINCLARFFFFLRSKTYKISRNRLEETDKDVSVELEIHPK